MSEASTTSFYEAMERCRESTKIKEESFLELAKLVAEQDEIDFATFALLATGKVISQNEEPHSYKEPYNFGGDHPPDPNFTKVCKNLEAMLNGKAQRVVAVTLPNSMLPEPITSRWLHIGMASSNQPYCKFLPDCHNGFITDDLYLQVRAVTPMLLPRYNSLEEKYVAHEEHMTVATLTTSLDEYTDPWYDHGEVFVGGEEVLSEVFKSGEDVKNFNLAQLNNFLTMYHDFWGHNFRF